jgi:hypothetical protein
VVVRLLINPHVSLLSRTDTTTKMNKWWLTGTAVLLLVVCAADAKKKWKADEDFEFEEVRLT